MVPEKWIMMLLYSIENSEKTPLRAILPEAEFF